MATTYHEDAWQEFVLIGIQEKGASEVQFAALTEDITAMDWGEKDIEAIPIGGGGNVVKRTPMSIEGMTVKMYPVSVDMDGSGIMQQFHPIGTTTVPDTADPIIVANTGYRRVYRIVLLWSRYLPTNPTSASTLPEIGDSAYRVQIFNAYLTAVKPSFDDKIYSVEATFKWAPFQKDGTRNKIEESTIGTAQLDAVTSFT